MGQWEEKEKTVVIKSESSEAFEGAVRAWEDVFVSGAGNPPVETRKTHDSPKKSHNLGRHHRGAEIDSAR